MYDVRGLTSTVALSKPTTHDFQRTWTILDGPTAAVGVVVYCGEVSISRRFLGYVGVADEDRELTCKTGYK